MTNRKTVLVLLAALCLAAAPPLRADGPEAPKDPKPEAVTVRFGGLLQVQADGGDRGDSRFPDSDVRFYLRRARASANATLPQGFDLRLEVELAGSLSSTSSLRAQLTDAWVGWAGKGPVRVRAGQLKTPFGYEQLLADPRMTTIERALGNDRLTPGRQVGVQLHGDLLGKRVTWAAGAFGGSGVNTTSNEDGTLLYAARIAGSAWKGSLGGAEATLSAGANGFVSEEKGLALPADFGLDSTPATPAADNLLTGRRSGAGVDLQLSGKRLELSAEALLVRLEPDAALPQSGFDASSVALFAGWEVIPKRLQLVARADRFDPNGDRSGDETSTLTLGGNWYVRGHDLKLQANLLASDVPVLGRQYKVVARIQAAF